jgi:flagellum-specific peptidoglycan hydrolase FlgJ
MENSRYSRTVAVDQDRPPEPSRRDFFKVVGAIAGAVAAGTVIEDRFDILASKDGEGEPSARDNEILVNPEKFSTFIDKYSWLAEELSQDPKRPVPFEVFLAVAAHESDSGTSELAERANNLFGMIAKDEWKGAIYNKVTQEEVSSADIPALRNQKEGFSVVSTLPGGRSVVKYSRPFRKYEGKSPVRDSFEDFARKICDSGYYEDVVRYLESGGRDPLKVIELMSNEDGPSYATDSYWREKVSNYIVAIQDITGKRSADSDIPEHTEATVLPEAQSSKIDIKSIDFKEFKQPRERKLKETIIASLEGISKEDYLRFKIVDRSETARRLLEAAGGNEALEYYDQAYGKPIDPDFIVWHLWANGVKDGGSLERGPDGSSKDIPLENQIKSWFNTGGRASCGFLMSQKGEVWQLGRHPFSKTWHAGNGVQDPLDRASHPNINNNNSLGVEVQADSVFDVSKEQFQSLIYLTASMLFKAQIVREGMTRKEVDAAIDTAVVGHGKNGGLEFGQRYTMPLKQALKQFVFMVV